MAIAKQTKQIRNIALLGHGGSGKTSFAEAMLYFTKATDRLGKPTDGNTVCDYDPEEIRRGFSLQTSIAPVNFKDVKINVIDTPGYLDFSGEVLQGVRVADSALILIDAKSGVEVGAELAWDYATDAGIPKSFFINKFDDPDAHFQALMAELREKFGHSACPVLIPMKDSHETLGLINLIEMKAYTFDKNLKRTVSEIPEKYLPNAEKHRAEFLESIAETSDELMEKFFAEEEITVEESLNALLSGIADGTIAPVICGSAINMWGVEFMLGLIADAYPAPKAVEGDPSVFVFKTIADPFVGKMSFFRVMSGNLTNDLTLKNLNSGSSEKFNHIYTVCGKKQTEVDGLCCGDIGMIPKLSNTNTNDTLTWNNEFSYAPITYPTPYLSKVMIPVSRGDEGKISQSIAKMVEEDCTIKFENDAETKQLLIYGLGDMHLAVLASRLKSRFGLNVRFDTPTVAYREKITKFVDVEGKHKKQNGGSGQYGHVKMKFGPGEEEGLTFTVSVVGGTVPKNFYPAVEKGIQDCMSKGAFGFPMTNLAADLYDGSYHAVDSDELSFKTAASLAYKKALE
ncbi:MAG: elongation factor G, partial [Clostridia bacterium]|nr:elongation factor G [Clostridia bacterium]